MGHKEDLLAGAKKCLREIGYAKTTARDIVAASGTNLASIGYHFGSKEALMTQAIIEMLGEWGEGFNLPPDDGTSSYAQRFERHWHAISETIRHDPQLAIASFENAATAARMPELKAIISVGQEAARDGFAEDFASHDADEATQRAVGSLMLAVTSGVISQFLIDPAKTPSSQDIVKAFRYIADAFARDDRPDAGPETILGRS
jgi:AcrR family transcriptional regulator